MGLHIHSPLTPSRCVQGQQHPTYELMVYFRNYCLLTPWSRVLPGKLTGPQLLKKFPACYGNQRFITAFTCPYPEPDRSSPSPHSTYRRYSLILFSHLRPTLFPTKTLYARLFSPYLPHVLPISFFLT